MAQLVERLVRNEEASGSNPLISTKNAGQVKTCPVFLLEKCSVEMFAVRSPYDGQPETGRVPTGAPFTGCVGIREHGQR